jgi:hypothetical protein
VGLSVRSELGAKTTPLGSKRLKVESFLIATSFFDENQAAHVMGNTPGM